MLEIRDIDEIITDPGSAEELFYYGDYFTKLKILNHPACPPEVAHLAVNLCKRGPVTYYDLDLILACNIWRVVGITEGAFNYLYEGVKLQEMVLAFHVVEKQSIEEPSTKVFYPTEVAEWSSLVGLIAHPYSWPHIYRQDIYCKDGLLLKHLSYPKGINFFVSYSKDSFYSKEVSELLLMGIALNPKVTDDVKRKLLSNSKSLKLRHCFEVNPVSDTSEKRLWEILSIYRNKCNFSRDKKLLALNKVVMAYVLAHPNGKGVLLSACLGGYKHSLLIEDLAKAVAKYENPWQAVIHYNDPELIPF